MQSPPPYAERLTVPWWWWPFGAAVTALLAAEVHSGAGGARAVVPYLVGAVLFLGGMATLSRGRIKVAEGYLVADAAQLPIEVVGSVRALTRDQVRSLLGPAADPAAYLVTRPWLPAAVLITLDDPDDDTPYWLIGTRHPDELVEALTRASPL
ncbi:MAG: DUF3093 domain-containing protein [Actinomycetota bacterium]|nr:DUF3093 domain-containing protein [Actinomycetota bacterium]